MGSGMCYMVVDTELSWNDARVECEFLAGHDRGGDLVSINSYDEQRYIMSKKDMKNYPSLSNVPQFEIMLISENNFAFFIIFGFFI